MNNELTKLYFVLSNIIDTIYMWRKIIMKNKIHNTMKMNDLNYLITSYKQLFRQDKNYE